MEEKRLLQELEEIAEKLSIAVQYDDLLGMDFNVKGGLCKLRGKNAMKPYVRLIIGDGSEIREKKNP
jgi:hypothetical protein